MVRRKHTNCHTSRRAGSCKCRLCYGYIATAEVCNCLLNFTAIGATADGCEVGRIWLLVDSGKKTRRRRGKNAARKGEEGEKDGGFAGEHLESCRRLTGGW
jgi:hypothetical protein